MNYELMVCPLCGAQVEDEGGYDGGLSFSCEHSSYMDEYGSIDPLRVKAEPVGLAEALAEAAPRMAEQRWMHEAQRRAAMTPQEREAEDRRNELTRKALHNVYAPMISDAIRDNNRVLWTDARVVVEPGTIKPD
jgi:hypothetical protein